MGLLFFHRELKVCVSVKVITNSKRFITHTQKNLTQCETWCWEHYAVGLLFVGWNLSFSQHRLKCENFQNLSSKTQKTLNIASKKRVDTEMCHWWWYHHVVGLLFITQKKRVCQSNETIADSNRVF